MCFFYIVGLSSRAVRGRGLSAFGPVHQTELIDDNNNFIKSLFTLNDSLVCLITHWLWQECIKLKLKSS